MIVYNLLRNKISFEGKGEITLSRELISEFNLKEREELSEEEFRELLLKACQNYSYYLLGIKNYFRKDLKNKLKEKFFYEDISEKVVLALEDNGYIDDLDSAKIYISSHKNYGGQKLRFELGRRGVEREVIEELLSENEDSEEQELRKLILRMSEKPPEKIIASLMRKGFSYKNIKKVLGEVGCLG